MNFYKNDDEEKKAGAPVIPGSASPFRKTSAFGRAPLFSRAAGGLTDRLKNLSRRDMAFVAIGLSVLVMAPVAEYMMSKPTESNMLTGGFGDRGGGNSALYEPGLGALSAGSPDGSGEVITPLSSRDPASLILGSQPAQPAAPPQSYAPPPTTFRDSVKDAGREAFSAASKSAGAPTVIPKMQSALRGMSFFGGDGATRTSGTLAGGKILETAKNASAKSAKRSMVGPVAMAGYKGVASNTPNSASKGAFEKLRSQADKSAGNFSGDSAIRSLDKAAADAIEVGKGAGGLGAGGEDDKVKGTNAYNNKYEHNRSGETLEEMMAKKRMDEALKWEFFKKYEIPKTIITAVVGAVSKELGDWVGKQVKGVLNPYTPSPEDYCWKNVGGTYKKFFKMSLCAAEHSNTDCSACEAHPSDWNGSGAAAAAGAAGAAGPGGAAASADPNNTNTTAGNGPVPVTWPTENAQTFDNNFALLRKDIDAAEKKVDETREFLTETSKVAKKLADLTGRGAQGYEFPFVAGHIEQTATKFTEIHLAYAGNVAAAQGEVAKFRGKHQKLLARLQAADSRKVARATGARLTEKSAIKSELIDVQVSTRVDSLKKQLTMLEDLAAGWEKTLTFCSRAAELYKVQTDFIIADSASKGGSEGLGARSLEISNKASALAAKFDGYLQPFAANEKHIPDPATMEKIAKDFTELTGLKLQIVNQAALKLNGDDGTDNSLVDQLRVLRGADKDAYWKSGKVDDAFFKDKEPKDWVQISPKAKRTDLEDPLESGARADKVVTSLNIRIQDELPNDLQMLNTMALHIHDANSDKDKLDQYATYSSSLETAVDNLLGKPSGGNTNPAVDPAVDPAAPAVPPKPTTGAGSSNSTAKLAETALKGIDDNLDENRVSKDAIDAVRDSCTTRACTTNLGIVDGAMGDMEAQQKRIRELKAEALKPGADTAKIESDIQDAQSKFNTAHKRFNAAAKGVTDATGVTAPNKPASTPNNPHALGSANLEKVREYAATLASCEQATGGFTKAAQANCSVEYSDRVTSLASPVDPYLGSGAAVDHYKFRVGVACDFVRACRSRPAVPAGCSGMSSGLSLKPTSGGGAVAAQPKPPVVVAQPKAPSQFLLGSVSFSTRDNSGDTVVYSSSRGVYPWYKVTCTRQRNGGFVITAGQINNGVTVKTYSALNGQGCK